MHCIAYDYRLSRCSINSMHTLHAHSDGQKLTKKLPTNSLTKFFTYTNGLTLKIGLVKPPV